jgi:hypothetical protein
MAILALQLYDSDCSGLGLGTPDNTVIIWAASAVEIRWHETCSRYLVSRAALLRHNCDLQSQAAGDEDLSPGERRQNLSL